jgi:hypothetical protein
MPQGKIQLWERPDYLAYFQRNAFELLDDEALGMGTSGIDISRSIQRSDGIHVSAEQLGIRYEIHFDPSNPSIGYYSVSAGPFRGSGRVVEVQKKETPSFPHYFYIKVVSQAAHLFVWRVAIESLVVVVDEA